jgi:poly(hydroxyalkanoate) depolymerase family esterase
MSAMNLLAMQKALALVRAGHLGDATAVIQSSLLPQHNNDSFPMQAQETATTRNGAAEDIKFKETSGKSLGRVIVASVGGLSYRLFIPAPNEKKEAAPLLVMLHGCKQTAGDFAVGTKMDSVAGTAGFFVVYPQQSNQANLNACWNWFNPRHQTRGQGEPKALADLITHLKEEYSIDAGKVFVAGLSAGGAMAAIMVEQYPELFAAVGVHSGLPTGLAKTLPQALQAMQGHQRDKVSSASKKPTIVFHGDSDLTVSPINGKHFEKAMTLNPDTVKETLEGVQGRQFTKHTYRDKGGNLIGEHWSINNAGHAWSGGNSTGSYSDSMGPDASTEMLRFFLAISKQGH